MKKKPTDEEIREGNLLIDEYMGADAISGITSYPDEPHLWHHSLDWTWPLLQKIERDIRPRGDEVAIEMFMGITYVNIGGVETAHEDSITAMWRACVKFVKLLKQNQNYRHGKGKD